VGLLSFFFVLKLLLDMSALSVVNIPMYGVLKSSTTPCVLLLDYLLR
jgi:solute carrier family 35 protein